MRPQYVLEMAQPATPCINFASRYLGEDEDHSTVKCPSFNFHCYSATTGFRYGYNVASNLQLMSGARCTPNKSLHYSIPIVYDRLS
jgi:hypothetical protein